MKHIYTLLLLSILSITTFAQNWDEVIKTVASDREAGDEFGFSVSIDGNKAIVGANKEAGGKGAAYIFEFNNGVWTETDKLVASDGAVDDRFGYSVSISGNSVIVGAYQEYEDASGGVSLTNAGSVYIFELSGGVWSEMAKLVASDREVNDNFGFNVSISNDKVVIGAFHEDHDASGGSPQPSAGSAYIFELSGGIWSETAKLVASDRGAADRFGISVCISGDKAIVGAYWEDHDASGGTSESKAGSAYIFELSGGVWSETAKLVASDRVANDFFGFSVEISGDRAIVAATGQDGDASGGVSLSAAGAAYVFDLSGGVWSETAKLVASDRATADFFGASVSISGDKVIIGANQQDDNTLGGDSLANAGAAYIFEFSGGVWLETAKLVASDRGADDLLGRGVSISGNNVIVGAFKEDDNVLGADSLANAGSAYIFTLSGGVGVDDLELTTDNLKLYPNPTTGNITIDLTELENTSVSITNSIGVAVYRVENVTQNKLDISLTKFSKGIYFVIIQSGNEFYTQKIIKQ